MLPNEICRSSFGKIGDSSGRRFSTQCSWSVPRSRRGGGLRSDRAPAGSPVTGLLMGCRARPGGVSTRSLACRVSAGVLCTRVSEAQARKAVALRRDVVHRRRLGRRTDHDLELDDGDGPAAARSSGCRRDCRESPDHTSCWREHAPAEWVDLTAEEVAGQSRRRHRNRPRPVGPGAARGRGYQVYAINPLSAARYRERHSTSGATKRRRRCAGLSTTAVDRDLGRVAAGQGGQRGQDRVL